MIIIEFDIEKKVEAIREVLHFENGIEHKILITHVIAKISICQRVSKGRLKTPNAFSDDLLIFPHLYSYVIFPL